MVAFAQDQDVHDDLKRPHDAAVPNEKFQCLRADEAKLLAEDYASGALFALLR